MVAIINGSKLRLLIDWISGVSDFEEDTTNGRVDIERCDQIADLLIKKEGLDNNDVNIEEIAKREKTLGDLGGAQKAFANLQEEKDTNEEEYNNYKNTTYLEKQQAKDLKIKNVTFHGSISEEEKVDLYHSLDIFVLSSDSEGHPVALLECMCAGAAPIVSDIPAIEGTVKDKQNGRIFKTGDVQQLTAAMNETISDINKLNQYKLEARKIVLEKYDLNKRAKKLKEIYEGLL